MILQQLVDRIRQSSSINKSAKILAEIGIHIGLPKLGCAHDLSLPVGPVDEYGEPVAYAWGWAQDFTTSWGEKRLSLHTPFFERCRYDHLPFVWSAEQFMAGAASRRQREVTCALKNHGYVNALVIPIHLPKGRVAAVSFWGDLSTEDVQQLIDLHAGHLMLASHHFLHQVGSEHDGAARKEPGALSIREVECLTFAGKGLSDIEIAYEMSISIHTVRFHVNNVTRRLQARNRTHAVALAAQLGVIGISTPLERMMA